MSVGIKINSEVTMNVRKSYNLVSKAVLKFRLFLCAVMCVSCLSSATLTSVCINYGKEYPYFDPDFHECF